MWNFHGTTEIIPLDLDALDGPPNHPPPRPPGLDSPIANWVAAEAKCCDGFVDAQDIRQDLEEMASRASSE